MAKRGRRLCHERVGTMYIMEAAMIDLDLLYAKRFREVKLTMIGTVVCFLN